MVSRRRGQRGPPKDDELIDYEISSQLVGTGAYSTIWRAYSKKDPGLLLAAKVSKKNARRTKKNYFGALSVLRNIVHPNLIKLHHYQETSMWYYLFLEYHPKPTETLTELIINGNISDSLIVVIFSQVASAVSYLHENGWGHRDVKPCNILFNPETQLVTVLDLGFAMPTHKLCDDFTGSPLYTAPEVLAFNKYQINLSDCWSLGVVLYQLLYGGKYPFLADDLQTLTTCVVNDELAFPKDVHPPSALRQSLKTVVEKLLRKNPQERISSTNLNMIFKEFMEEIGEGKKEGVTTDGVCT